MLFSFLSLLLHFIALFPDLGACHIGNAYTYGLPPPTQCTSWDSHLMTDLLAISTDVPGPDASEHNNNKSNKSE